MSMTVTIKEGLVNLGYTYQAYTLDSELYREYKAPNGWTWIYSKRYRNYPFISIAARKISINKLASYEFASIHGITVPATLYTSDIQAASKFLDEHRRVIVKPLDQGGSRGLTLDITAKDQLRVAMGGNSILIQKQFIGMELRFTILKGKVESVILRQTPQVVGDSRHTIQQLIALENGARKKLQFPLLAYPLLDETNTDHGFMGSSTIPAQGEIVELSRATMISKGASFHGVLHSVHESYMHLTEALAIALNSAMIAVDLIVEDYTIPATEDNYVFLEFNTAPAPQIYSSLRSGDQPLIVDKIVSMIDEYAHIYGPNN